MSTTNYVEQIEYPESDGKPVGETDTHFYWIVRIHDLLSNRYRNQRVYVSSDLLIYYEEGDSKRFVVPDNFVVLDCDPRRRRVFKTWEEGRGPDVVFEVTSRSTRQQDGVAKPQLYERIGVQEYFLYDPTAEYLEPALQGYRWQEGAFVAIEPANNELACETLGFHLRLDQLALEFIDSSTRERLLTEAETQHAARLAAEARVRELEAELERHRNEDQ